MAQYKIISVADLSGKLSVTGERLLLSARYSNDKKNIIRCISHSQERIALAFVGGFDIQSFLTSIKTYSQKEALLELKKPEWACEMTGDL